jgi:hypothetical protein
MQWDGDEYGGWEFAKSLVAFHGFCTKKSKLIGEVKLFKILKVDYQLVV